MSDLRKLIVSIGQNRNETDSRKLRNLKGRIGYCRGVGVGYGSYRNGRDRTKSTETDSRKYSDRIGPFLTEMDLRNTYLNQIRPNRTNSDQNGLKKILEPDRIVSDRNGLKKNLSEPNQTETDSRKYRNVLGRIVFGTDRIGQKRTQENARTGSDQIGPKMTQENTETGRKM